MEYIERYTNETVSRINYSSALEQQTMVWEVVRRIDEDIMEEFGDSGALEIPECDY